MHLDALVVSPLFLSTSTHWCHPHCFHFIPYISQNPDSLYGLIMKPGHDNVIYRQLFHSELDDTLAVWLFSRRDRRKCIRVILGRDESDWLTDLSGETACFSAWGCLPTYDDWGETRKCLESRAFRIERVDSFPLAPDVRFWSPNQELPWTRSVSSFRSAILGFCCSIQSNSIRG